MSVEIGKIVTPYGEARDFMGVIGIRKPDEKPIILVYGFANLELSVPHTIDSNFMIGSISKQITAAAILLLEQDGKLNTSDKLSVHMPELTHGDEITIEQLLTHTSGMVDVYSLKSFGATNGQAHDFDAIVTEIDGEPLMPAPGTQFRYSNGGYALLAAIIERVSQMDYGDFLRARIFGPLGMQESSHQRSGPVVKSRVSGYDPWSTRELIPTVPVSTAYLKGSGSLWSTAADMLTWSEGLHGGKLLDAERYAKLTRDYGSSYGFGVSVFQRFGRNTIGHDGRTAGFASDFARYVEDETTVVVLGNVQSVSRDIIREQVAATIFGEPVATPQSRKYSSLPKDIEIYQGAFSFGPGFTVYTKVFDGQRLMARANEGAWSELVPLQNGRWFSRMLFTSVRFERDENDQIQSLVWGAGDGAPTGTRGVTH